jgi:hypothetical protein
LPGSELEKAAYCGFFFAETGGRFAHKKKRQPKLPFHSTGNSA